MKINYSALYLGLLLIGCGEATTREFDTTDPVFEEYIEELDSMSQEFTGQELISSTPVNFKALAATLKGICRRHSDGTKEIYIDPSKWEVSDRDARLALLMHEIGHCSYGKGHDDSVTPDTYPKSIMNNQLAVNGNTFRVLKERFFINFHMENNYE